MTVLEIVPTLAVDIVSDSRMASARVFVRSFMPVVVMDSESRIASANVLDLDSFLVAEIASLSNMASSGLRLCWAGRVGVR